MRKRKDFIDLLTDAVITHYHTFEWCPLVPEEWIRDEAKGREFIDLVNKSKTDNVDYVVDRYNMHEQKERDLRPFDGACID